MKKYKMMILIPERHLRMDWLIYTGDNVLYTPVQPRGLHVPSSQRGLWTQTGPVVLWEDRGGTSCLNGLRYHIWIVTWQFWGRTIPLSGDKLQEVFARLTERLKQFAVFMIVMRSGDSKGHNHSFHTQMIQWPPSVPVIISNLERVRNVSTLSKKKTLCCGCPHLYFAKIVVHRFRSRAQKTRFEDLNSPFTLRLGVMGSCFSFNLSPICTGMIFLPVTERSSTFSAYKINSES